MKPNWSVVLAVSITVVFVISALVALSEPPKSSSVFETPTFSANEFGEVLVEMRISSATMSPQEFFVAQGSVVTLNIRSLDFLEYVVIEPESGIEIVILPNESSQISFTARENLVFEAVGEQGLVGISRLRIS